MSLKWIVLGALLVAGVGGFLLVECGSYAIGVGTFSVTIHFEPAPPSGARVSYMLVKSEWVSMFVENDPHPEWSGIEITAGKGPVELGVPFTARSSSCFRESRYRQPYDTVLFLFELEDGRRVFYVAGVPVREAADEVVPVREARKIASPRPA